MIVDSATQYTNKKTRNLLGSAFEGKLVDSYATKCLPSGTDQAAGTFMIAAGFADREPSRRPWCWARLSACLMVTSMPAAGFAETEVTPSPNSLLSTLATPTADTGFHRVSRVVATAWRGRATTGEASAPAVICWPNLAMACCGAPPLPPPFFFAPRAMARAWSCSTILAAFLISPVSFLPKTKAISFGAGAANAADPARATARAIITRDFFIASFSKV